MIIFSLCPILKQDILTIYFPRIYMYPKRLTNFRIQHDVWQFITFEGHFILSQVQSQVKYDVWTEKNTKTFQIKWIFKQTGYRSLLSQNFRERKDIMLQCCCLSDRRIKKSTVFNFLHLFCFHSLSLCLFYY